MLESKKIFNTNLVRSFHLLLTGVVLFGSACLASETVKVQTFKTHGRLSFRVDESVTVTSKNTAKGFELFFPGLGLTDLGAPLGEEENWAAQFETVADPRIASLKFREKDGGVRVTGAWKYPSGAQALAHPEMEWFDYREKKGETAFVVDFWVKAGPTLAQIQEAQKKNRLALLQKNTEQAERERNQRRIASLEQRKELEDLNRFCTQPLTDARDVFLPFYPVHEKVDFHRWFSTNTADARYDYSVPTGKSKEDQYVRLAQQLYQQGKPALVIKTLDFYNQEFPKSSFKEEMKFLRANALIRLGQTADADLIFSKLMGEEPDAPVALYSAMYLAAKKAQENSALSALETFSWLINHYPKYRLAWVFHLGAAESLFALKETDRAAKEYQWIMENAPDSSSRAEAGMRLGDIFLDRFQYEQALAGYSQGQAHFKVEAKAFAPIHINQAEALYGMGEYERAAREFQAFLEQYPSHPSGWRATYRLAEIAGRRPGQYAQMRTYFLETVNRFPFSPGSTLSRMMIIPCGDHGGFDLASTDKFYNGDVKKFDGAKEVSLAKYPDYVAVSQVRAWISLGEETRAVNVALASIKVNPHEETKKVLASILGGLFRKTILDLLDAGKKYEAIAFFNEQEKTLTHEGGIVEPDFLLKLSQAASDIGLGDSAMRLSEVYKKFNANRSLANGGTSDADVDAQLKISEQNFTEAKALWVSQGMKAQDRIRELLDKVKEESRFSYERELIWGLLDEKAGNLNLALHHAVKAQVLTPQEKGKLRDMRVDAWVASLQAKVGDPDVALSLYSNLESHLKLTKKMAGQNELPSKSAQIMGVPIIPTLEQVLISEAQILEKLGRWGEVASIYSRALDAGLGGNQAAFGHAHALIQLTQKTKRKQGFAELEKLAANAKEDFWQSLAKQTLENERQKRKLDGE